jgi:hypothetical protein
VISASVHPLYDKGRTIIVYLHAWPTASFIVVKGHKGTSHSARQFLVVTGAVTQLTALPQAKCVESTRVCDMSQRMPPVWQTKPSYSSVRSLVLWDPYCQVYKYENPVSTKLCICHHRFLCNYWLG